MALYVITGQEAVTPERPSGHFVPRNARFSVFTSESNLVKGGKTQGKEIPLDLEDGKYRYKIVKPGVCNFGAEFYVGVTPEEWKLLDSRKTSWARVDHTTEGVRWTCKLCKRTNMTKAGAIKHEWSEHLGLDPLKATDEEIEDALEAPQPMAGPFKAAAADEPSPIPRRPVGRPRKAPVTD